jgi:alpha-tubulin suppressor-like RCC1 family protein
MLRSRPSALFAAMLGGIVLSASSPAALAAERDIAMVTMDTYIMPDDPGTYTASNYFGWIDTLEGGGVRHITQFTELDDALRHAEVVIIPMFNRPNTSFVTDMGAARLEALRTFVRNGGTLYCQMEWAAQGEVARLLHDGFGWTISTSTYTQTPGTRLDLVDRSLVDDSLPLPARVDSTYYVNYLSQTPAAPIRVLYQMNNLPVVVASPYGSGLVVLSGVHALAPTTQAPETDLVKTLLQLPGKVFDHTCLKVADAVRCVGNNQAGQLGDGAVQHVMRYNEAHDVALGTGFAVSQVKQGFRFNCALSTDGRVKCWGNNDHGQLGLGDTTPRGTEEGQLGDALPAVALPADAHPTAIAVGFEHACAVLSNGSLRCWGEGAHGELGNETNVRIGDATGEAPAQVLLPRGLTAVQVVAGQGHTCALLSDESVRCFGSNAYGQLGNGTRTDVGATAGSMGDALRAVPLGAGFHVRKLVAGAHHTCALGTDGHVKCWGANASGQLGLGSIDDVGAAPVDPATGYTAADLGIGQLANDLSCGSQHCCALMVQQTLKCWGANGSGQLGLGDTRTRGIAPLEMGDDLPFVEMQDLEEVHAVSLTASRTCATTTRGTLCWGDNRAGQLGTGDQRPRGSTPETVPALLAPVIEP